MTENTEKTADDVLLDDILNELDMTSHDEGAKRKIKDIMQRGKARLVKLAGAEIDFAKDMMARELLFSYCRYGRSNAIEQFEGDFSCQLTAFTLEEAVASMTESGATDEGKV